MAQPGDVLEVPRLGLRIEFRTTTAQTGGERLEFDVVGRPRGFVAQAHVHPAQSERHEVIEGAMAMRRAGRTQVLRPGDSVLTPAGVAHRHVAADSETGRVRVLLRPALRTESWLERIAAMDRDGELLRSGFPRPVAGARLVADYAGEAHAAFPPVAVQRALIGAVLRVAALGSGSREYAFVDEWDVQAPVEAVYAALADGASYPVWWRPVYLESVADGPARVGQTSRQRFQGRLPYRLSTRTRITRHEPPHVLQAEVEGDLRGRGTWTLRALPAGGTHVRFDWEVHADRPLLRRLSPVLRPAFRWNHAWAIARAQDGLEPYAQRLARAA